MSNAALDALYALREHREIEDDRERLKNSLYEFIKAGWHTWRPNEQFISGWHLEVVCDHLQAVTRGEIRRLQVWVPPGTMKTGAVSIFWPAWEWTIDPGLNYWTASYSIRRSGYVSSLCRAIMISSWYQERWGDKFRFSREAEGLFTNDQGGLRLSTAPESEGTGYHGHRIIIDDPIPALEAEAISGTELQKVNDWYDGTVVSRGLDGDPDRGNHARVIVMQRLHENDLAGHVLDVDEWEVLCLPERYERNHPFVWPGDPREEGELLWPERRDEKTSTALTRSLRIRAAGQLQQRPAAREGEILKREWWQFYDPRFRSDPSKLPKFTMIVVSVDTPLKDKESNDLVAVQAYGVHGPDRYLLDLDKGHMNYSKAKRRVKEMAIWARKLWPRCQHYLLIENAGFGVEMIIDLKRELTGVIKIPGGLEGNKISRAESASDALESGNIFVPGHGPPWQPSFDDTKTPDDVSDFINNCAVFPMSLHDDDVDSWSQAMNWLRSKAAAPMRTSSPHKRGRR